MYRLWGSGAEAENLVPQWYADSDGNPIVVSIAIGQEVRDVLIELQQGGYIRSTVTAAADGQAISGVYVAANEIGGELSRSTFSAADGTYRIAGLADADYLVVAVDPASPEGKEVVDYVEKGCTTQNLNARLETDGALELAGHPTVKILPKKAD